MEILALVPARGGSKGLPGKNILPLGGKPLIAWTIEAALGSRFISECIVSTDNEEIASVARAAGASVPFLRPANLADDTASSLDVVLHTLEWAKGQGKKYDTLLLLQPTSPLRTAEDIDSALDLFSGTNLKSCVSICETEHSPYWAFSLDDAGRLHEILPTPEKSSRRQDLPVTYQANGALYIENLEWLLEKKTFIARETIGFVMPCIRSVDIDSALDMLVAEAILAQQNSQ